MLATNSKLINNYDTDITYNFLFYLPNGLIRILQNIIVQKGVKNHVDVSQLLLPKYFLTHFGQIISIQNINRSYQFFLLLLKASFHVSRCCHRHTFLHSIAKPLIPVLFCRLLKNYLSLNQYWNSFYLLFIVIEMVESTEVSGNDNPDNCVEIIEEVVTPNITLESILLYII